MRHGYKSRRLGRQCHMPWYKVNMFENLPLIGMNVRILHFWSLLYDNNPKRIVYLALGAVHVLTQLYYMMMTDEGISGIIRNSYMLVLWINTLIRGILLISKQDKYIQLIITMKSIYNELAHTTDEYILGLLRNVNKTAKLLTRGNLLFGFLTSIGFGVYPLSCSKRVLPFGSKIPGIDEYATPYYQLWYIFHMLITPMGCCMFIPYTNLIVALIMFGIVMCKALQHRLQGLSQMEQTSEHLNAEIIACITQQQHIIDFMNAINVLTAYIFLMEFLAFGALLCALLFMLLIVDSTAQMIIVCAYINMILAQIFALYWYANELREQNMLIAMAAYDTEWFNFTTPMKKNISFMILRSQRPPAIMLGNIRPITLQLFLKLLNTSYSLFTVLKRIYG